MWERLGLSRWGMGLFLHLLAAYFSEGFFQADEHFQILEFAHAKFFPGPGLELPWEFGAQIRPWLLPAFFGSLFRTLHFFHVDNPFFLAFVARSVSALFAFAVTLKVFRYFERKAALPQEKGHLLALFSVALFFVPFFHARSSSENWAGALFLLGWVWWQEGRWGWAGVALGMAFECRFQTGLLMAGAFAAAPWWWRRWDWKNLREPLFIALGLGLAFFLGRWVDRWGYGSWTNTPWHYFSRNLLQGEAIRHGTTSAAAFVVKFLLVLPPLGAILCAAFVNGLRRLKEPTLVGAVLLFVAAHLLIAHKEMRFLFPLLHLAPFAIFYGIPFESEKLRTGPWISALCLLNGVALIFLCLSPAKSEISLYKAVYHRMKSQALATFEYSHVDDDPLRYAGLRPQFYLPFRVESHRLASFNEFRRGVLLLSANNLDAPEVKGVLERSTCEVLWADSFARLRAVPWIEWLLRVTKYRFQFMIQCP